MKNEKQSGSNKDNCDDVLEKIVKKEDLLMIFLNKSKFRNLLKWDINRKHK